MLYELHSIDERSYGMSEKRRAANERNALRSTGPKTEAGNARSRLNALKHGAYAQVCIEGEDLSRLKALLLDLVAEYKPEGFEERLIITEIAQTIWRKNRYKVAEALAMHAYSFLKSHGEPQRGDLALAVAQDAGAYGTIPPCLEAEDLLDRRLWALFDRLRKLQKKRGVYHWKSNAITADAAPAQVITNVPKGRAKAFHRAGAPSSNTEANSVLTHKKPPRRNNPDQAPALKSPVRESTQKK